MDKAREAEIGEVLDGLERAMTPATIAAGAGISLGAEALPRMRQNF